MNICFLKASHLSTFFGNIFSSIQKDLIVNTASYCQQSDLKVELFAHNGYAIALNTSSQKNSGLIVSILMMLITVGSCIPPREVINAMSFIVEVKTIFLTPLNLGISSVSFFKIASGVCGSFSFPVSPLTSTNWKLMTMSEIRRSSSAFKISLVFSMCSIKRQFKRGSVLMKSQ